MKHFSMMILLMAAILLSSCGEHSVDEPLPLTKENTLEQLTSTTEVGLVEIGNIIKAFNRENNRPATRGNDFYASAICDADGNPQIYVINFTDNRGFILISATKDYNPILAYNTEGNFDISGEFPGGLKLWQTETAEAMAYVKTLPEDSLINFRHLWSKYEDHSTTSYSSRGLPENELGQILLAKKAELQAQGYIIHDINSSITGVNNIDRQFREEAEGGIHPEYDWRMYSFVASKDISIVQTCNNLISTTWGQEGQYNCTFPTKNGKRYVAGCGPVAAGQIMKYYKHPSKYSWTSMTNNIGNEAISNLLYDIGKSAKANFGTDKTSTTIGNMNETFKSFGYTTSYGDHKTGNAMISIQNHKLVYMRGDLKGAGDSDGGHAWVASGVNYVQGRTEYTLYFFRNSTIIDSASKYIYAPSAPAILFYMNWGWYGNYDGFYYDNRLNPGAYASVSNRKDIYNIYPK